MEVNGLSVAEKRVSAIHQWSGFTRSTENELKRPRSLADTKALHQEVERKGWGEPKLSQPGSGFIAPLTSALASSVSHGESITLGHVQKRKGADVPENEHLRKKPKWHQEVAGQGGDEEPLPNPTQLGGPEPCGLIAPLSSALASSVSADHFQKGRGKCNIQQVQQVKARCVAHKRKGDQEESQQPRKMPKWHQEDERQGCDEPNAPHLSCIPLPKWTSSLFSNEAQSKESGQNNILHVSQKRKSPDQQDSGHLQKKPKQLQTQEEPQPSTSYGTPVKCIGHGLPYVQGRMLGKGGFGSVYAGTRISDGLQVAIKYVSKDRIDDELEVDGQLVPIEVALMKKVNTDPACPNILKLVEWFEQPTRYIMILERPEPCQDLSRFCEESGGLDENLARGVMVQLISALKHCESQRVLHRDVKPQNILINTDTHDVKLLDFGCGDILKNSPYRLFAGTFEYAPPEWFLFRRYHARPATVWSLGVTLYNILCGKLPFRTRRDIIKGRLHMPEHLSIGKIEPTFHCPQRDQYHV